MVDEQKSAYNEALNKIGRISNIISMCGYYARNGELDSWRWELDNFYRELEIHADKVYKDGLTYKKAISLLDKVISLASKSHKRDSLYHLLHKKEVLLRHLQDLMGLGDKYDDVDDSEDW
jgi:hypothetical protein